MLPAPDQTISSESSSSKAMRRAVLPVASPNKTLFGIRNALYAQDALAFRDASPPAGSTTEKDSEDSRSEIEWEWIIGNVPMPPKPLSADIRLPRPPLLRAWLAVNNDESVRLELCETIQDPDVPLGLSRGIGCMPIPIPGISKRNEAFCPPPDAFLQVTKEGEWIPESDFCPPRNLPYPPWHYRTFYPPTTSAPASADVSDSEAQRHPSEKNDGDGAACSDRGGGSHSDAHNKPQGGNRGQPRREEQWSANQEGRRQKPFGRGRGGTEPGSWGRRGSHRRGFHAFSPSHRDRWGSRNDRRQQPDWSNEEGDFCRHERHFEEQRGRRQRDGQYHFIERSRNPDRYSRHPETCNEPPQRHQHRYDEGRRNGRQQRSSGHRSKGWNKPPRRDNRRFDERNRFPDQRDRRFDERNRFPDQRDLEDGVDGQNRFPEEKDRPLDERNRFPEQRDHHLEEENTESHKMDAHCDERNEHPDRSRRRDEQNQRPPRLDQRFEERTRRPHRDNHHMDERRDWPNRRNDDSSRGWNRQPLTKLDRSKMPPGPLDHPPRGHGNWQRKWNEDKGFQNERQDDFGGRPHRRNNRFLDRQSTWPDAPRNDDDHHRHDDRSSFNSHQRDRPTFPHSRQRSPRGRFSFQRGRGRNENRNRSPRRSRPDFEQRNVHPSESHSGWHPYQEDQGRRETNGGDGSGERQHEDLSHVENTATRLGTDLQGPGRRPPDVNQDNRRPNRNGHRQRRFRRKPHPKSLSYPNAVPVGQAPSHSPRDPSSQRRTEDGDGNQVDGPLNLR